MGRLLAIDYGRKRSGIAVTDTLQIIANGLTTERSHTLIDFLKDYTSKETVDKIIVGMPRTTSNEDSDNMKYVKIFVKQLTKALPEIPIEMFDERFTSVLAHQAMLAGGMKKMDRRDKAVVDKISAAIILNDYLNSKQRLL